MEPGTFTQYYSHLVFCPKLYCPIQSVNTQDRLFKFISGIVKNLGHRPLAVNGMYDHVHVFYGMKPTICPPETVKEIKRVSTIFLKDEFKMHNFKWQEGYGGFSYSRSQIDSVIRYIINQREHHKKKTFREEYIEFLEMFEIEYDPKYLFAFHE